MIKSDEFCPDLCATPAASHRGRVFVSQPLTPPASGVFLLELQQEFAFCLTLPFLHLGNDCLFLKLKMESVHSDLLAVSSKEKSSSFHICFNILSHCRASDCGLFALSCPLLVGPGSWFAPHLCPSKTTKPSNTKPTLACNTKKAEFLHLKMYFIFLNLQICPQKEKSKKKHH